MWKSHAPHVPQARRQALQTLGALGLGTAMATAVLTTLYGAFVANAFFLPAANKLGVQSESEVLNKEIIMQAIFFMQAGGNPRVLEEQLSSYLAPRIRTSA